MDFNITLDRFKLVSGLTDEEVSKWFQVIKDASDYVYSLVTKDNLTDNDKRRLDKASGIYAYYKYVLYSLSTENSFSVGDVSVTENKDRVKEAKDMWKKEMSEIGDIITTSTFLFKRL